MKQGFIYRQLNRPILFKSILFFACAAIQVGLIWKVVDDFHWSHTPMVASFLLLIGFLLWDLIVTIQDPTGTKPRKGDSDA